MLKQDGNVWATGMGHFELIRVGPKTCADGRLGLLGFQPVTCGSAYAKPGYTTCTTCANDGDECCITSCTHVNKTLCDSSFCSGEYAWIGLVIWCRCVHVSLCVGVCVGVGCSNLILTLNR